MIPSLVDLLIDTHALFWWFSEPSRLSERALSIIRSPGNRILVSAALAWEMAIKINLGRMQAMPLVLDLSRHISEEGFAELVIGIEAATRAGLLPLHHRDPFDRLLVAQAQSLNLPILSADALLDAYDVRRIW